MVEGGGSGCSLSLRLSEAFFKRLIRSLSEPCMVIESSIELGLVSVIGVSIYTQIICNIV